MNIGKSSLARCFLGAALTGLANGRSVIVAVLAVATVPLLLLGAPGARADEVRQPYWIGPARAQAQTIQVAPATVQQVTPAVIPQLELDVDSAGELGNFMPGGPVTTSGQSFFDTTLTSNGRSCFTCHQPQADWSFTPAGAQARFKSSNGTDPLFQAVDGANCPNTPSLHGLLLNQGLNRIFIALNPELTYEFSISVASDPTNCETGPYGLGATTGNTPTPGLSVYRRPLPASNLIFMNLVNSAGALKCNPAAVPNTGTPAGAYSQNLGSTGYTGTIAQGSTALHLTVAPERQLFVGQPVIVAGAGDSNPPNGSTPLNLLVTTVAAVVDAQDYTLSNAATHAVTGATVNGPKATNGEVGISESCENIMWDGREPDLRSQFIDATQFHGQTTATPSEAQQDQGVLFQQGIFTAQTYDHIAQDLDSHGGNGGPVLMPGLYPDGQDSLPPGTTNTTFDLFDGWTNPTGPANKTNLQRQSIARGQFIFNNVNIALSGVAGFNNAVGPGEGRGAAGGNNPADTGFIASCNTCHNIKNVGGEVLLHLVNTGVGYGAATGKFGLKKQTGLPVFEMICTAGVACQPTGPGQTCYNDTEQGVRPPFPPAQNGTNLGQVCTPQAPCTVLTDDPGAALISGRCDDIGAFKTPALRGIVARAPYFHDGSAATLTAAVNFYNSRFYMCLPTTQGGSCTPGTGHLTPSQVQDLVNFLSAL